MEEPISFMEWISSCEETSKLLFHPSGEIVLSECDLSVKASLVIGPEGGFSEKEILQAKNHDFCYCKLRSPNSSHRNRWHHRSSRRTMSLWRFRLNLII